MIKYVLPAAVAALALGAPAAVYAQSAAPQPMAQPAPSMTTNASATMTGQPQAGQSGQPRAQPMNQGYGPPMEPNPYMQPGFTQRTVWVPGNYNWDPVRQAYIWTEGQYTEAPREDAQWVPGHWAETPTAWIWVDGRWN